MSVFTLCRIPALGIAAVLALSAPAMSAEFEIRLATIAQSGQPIDLATTRFKEAVETGSNGRVGVTIYPGGQLGGEIEIQDNVAIGTIQMAVIGSPVTVGKLPKLDVLNMYYLWRDRGHMNAVLTGPIGQKLFDEYKAASGVDVLAANWQQGTRQTLIKHEAHTPADMKGVKIRVTAGVPIYDALWSAMGASPVPLPFPDAYSAMQTGVVDGVELPLDFIHNNGFQDLGKFLIKTDHYLYANFAIINNDFFAALPEDLQKVVRDAALEAGEYETSIVASQEAELMEKLKQGGVTVVEADREKFHKSVQPVIEARMDDWGRDLYDAIIATPSK